MNGLMFALFANSARSGYQCIMPPPAPLATKTLPPGIGFIIGMFVMAFFILSISVGNLFTSAVNFLIQNDDGSSKLAGADYFLFFTGLMLVTAITFAVVARFYSGKRHLHQERPDNQEV